MNARLFLIISCVLLTACQKKEASKENGQERVSFDRAEFSDITPMVDGSAYAKSADSQLWYLRGEQAIRVVLPGRTSEKPPESFDVTPLADGSAYLIASPGDGGLWHLRGERAQRVSEVSVLASVVKPTTPSSSGFFALYVAEHKKRQAAEERANNPPEPPDADNDYDPYP